MAATWIQSSTKLCNPVLYISVLRLWWQQTLRAETKSDQSAVERDRKVTRTTIFQNGRQIRLHIYRERPIVLSFRRTKFDCLSAILIKQIIIFHILSLHLEHKISNVVTRIKQSSVQEYNTNFSEWIKMKQTTQDDKHKIQFNFRKKEAT